MCKSLISKIAIEGLAENEWQEICSDLNCITIEAKAPRWAHAWTVNRGHGNIIYINSNMCDAKKRDALVHELMHLYNNDFQEGKPLKNKENI